MYSVATRLQYTPRSCRSVLRRPTEEEEPARGEFLRSFGITVLAQVIRARLAYPGSWRWSKWRGSLSYSHRSLTDWRSRRNSPRWPPPSSFGHVHDRLRRASLALLELPIERVGHSRNEVVASTASAAFDQPLNLPRRQIQRDLPAIVCHGSTASPFSPCEPSTGARDSTARRSETASWITTALRGDPQDLPIT